MTAAGRSPNAAAHERSADPGRRAAPQSRASWASRRPSRRAAVEDGRLAGLERERQVAPQVGQLVRDRAEDAVVVEAGLADRDDPRVGRPGDDPRPAGVVDLGRVVRMDRRPRRRATANRSTQPSARSRRGDVPARDEDPLDAGQPGAADDQVGVALEPVRVEVAVAVDQTHRHRGRTLTGRRASQRRRRRSRRRAAGRAAPARDTRPASPAWAPQASSSRIGGPPLPSGPYG